MLPAAFTQKQGLIIRLLKRQGELASAVNTALDVVVAAMSQAREDMSRALEAHGQKTEGVESALAELQQEGRKTQESLGQVLSDRAETRTDVKQLQLDMTQVKTDVRRIYGSLDRGFGTNYEAKLPQNVRSIVGQQVGVSSSRVLKGPSLRTEPDFDQQVESAKASVYITEDVSDELVLLDMIVSGNQTGTRERVYPRIEVSISANDDDVNRAAARAEILRKGTGGLVMAAVIAARVVEPRRELAAKKELRWRSTRSRAANSLTSIICLKKIASRRSDSQRGAFRGKKPGEMTSTIRAPYVRGEAPQRLQVTVASRGRLAGVHQTLTVDIFPLLQLRRQTGHSSHAHCELTYYIISPLFTAVATSARCVSSLSYSSGAL